ncbi:unnamed protein product [Toxocara canis]|nr:unnamed protein product [Toxocara canis]
MDGENDEIDETTAVQGFQGKAIRRHRIFVPEEFLVRYDFCLDETVFIFGAQTHLRVTKIHKWEWLLSQMFQRSEMEASPACILVFAEFEVGTGVAQGIQSSLGRRQANFSELLSLFTSEWEIEDLIS